MMMKTADKIDAKPTKASIILRQTAELDFLSRISPERLLDKGGSSNRSEFGQADDADRQQLAPPLLGEPGDLPDSPSSGLSKSRYFFGVQNNYRILEFSNRRFQWMNTIRSRISKRITHHSFFSSIQPKTNE